MSAIDLKPVRQYLQALKFPIDPNALIQDPRQRLSTLCYLTSGDRLLMLRRRKEPFSKHWTAPGGKIEDGETPLEAVVREMWEETGLTLTSPKLKVVCSEVGDEEYNWLLFIFAATAYKGKQRGSDEGELRWLPLVELEQWRLPDVDRRIMKLVLDREQAVRYVRVEYGPDHSVARFEVTPLAEMVG